MGINSKVKGASWEREASVLLSLWITNGKKKDCFWRSAMSGGRATVAKRAGDIIRQDGDICAVAPEGHALADALYIECKFLKNCSLDAALEGKGDLVKIWNLACANAQAHLKFPVILLKRNHRRPLWITCATAAKLLSVPTIGIINVRPGSVIPNTMHVLLLQQVLDAKPPVQWRGTNYEQRMDPKPRYKAKRASERG